MHGQVILKNIFSVLNILLILYLMLGERKSRRYNAVRSRYSLIICVVSLVLFRMMANGAELHIVYNYVSIIIIVMIIGHFLFQYSIKSVSYTHLDISYHHWRGNGISTGLCGYDDYD